jgi:hypothetical protein
MKSFLTLNFCCKNLNCFCFIYISHMSATSVTFILAVRSSDMQFCHLSNYFTIIFIGSEWVSIIFNSYSHLQSCDKYVISSLIFRLKVDQLFGSFSLWARMFLQSVAWSHHIVPYSVMRLQTITKKKCSHIQNLLL